MLLSTLTLINFISLITLTYLSGRIYCSCSENSGINHVSWSGLQRISNLKSLTEQEKDQIFQACSYLCVDYRNYLPDFNLSSSLNLTFPHVRPTADDDDQSPPSNLVDDTSNQSILLYLPDTEASPTIIYDDDCYLDDDYLDDD